MLHKSRKVGELLWQLLHTSKGYILNDRLKIKIELMNETLS